MAAGQASYGYMWLTILPYSRSRHRGNHVGFASNTDAVLEVRGEMDAVSARYATGKRNVSLRPLGVLPFLCFSESKKDHNPLIGYTSRVVNHHCFPVWDWGDRKSL